MQVIKKSERISPKISLILLDWSVRESFHFLHYLKSQTVARDDFEVVIIEYYSRISTVIKQFEDQVDSWVLLEMPSECYYHKHLMYNVGITYAKGEIIVICDSDAMVKPTFLASILQKFAEEGDIFLHLDQYRNHRKDLYPFCYPSFETVEGRGCGNKLNAKPKGLSIVEDVLHERNYGACFCARRVDLLQIGGADEHIDYVGHVCGPYDMSFRLLNAGKREVWHDTEFLYHTWHPGQAGDNNYYGPHDGRGMSSTALNALFSRQVLPHTMSPLIAELRLGKQLAADEIVENAIPEEYKVITQLDFLQSENCRNWSVKHHAFTVYYGFYIFLHDERYYALSSKDAMHWLNGQGERVSLAKSCCDSADDIQQLQVAIDKRLKQMYRFNACWLSIFRFFNNGRRFVLNVNVRLFKKLYFVTKKNMQKVFSPGANECEAKVRILQKSPNVSAKKISVRIRNMFALPGYPYTIECLAGNLLSHQEERQLIILTDNSAEYCFVNMLKIPADRKIKAAFVKKNYAKIAAKIAELSEKYPDATLCLGRNFYIMYFLIVINSDFRERILVL